MVNLVKENNLFFRIKKVWLMNQNKAKNKTWKKGDRLLFSKGRKPLLRLDISNRKSSLSPFLISKTWPRNYDPKIEINFCRGLIYQAHIFDFNEETLGKD